MKFLKRRLILGGLAGCAILLVPAAVVLWMSFHPKLRPAAPRIAALAITPDLRRVYISDYEQREIVAYSLESGEQVSKIRLRDGPGAVAFSPDGAKAYAMTYRDETNRAIAVIDTAASAVLAVIPANDYPHDSIAVSADGKRLTLASTYGHADAVTVQIDTTTHAPVAQARRLSATFHSPGVLAANGAAYAIACCATCDPPDNHGPGNPGAERRDYFVKLLRTDASNGARSIPAGPFQVHRIGISPDGGVIAMLAPEIARRTTSLRLADTTSGRTLAEMEVEAGYFLDMKFSDDGKYLYVLNDTSANALPTLIRIDVKTQQVDMLRLPFRPREISAASKGALVVMRAMSWDKDRYAAHTRALIHVYDSRRAALVRTVPLRGSVQHMLQELAWNAADEIRRHAPWSDNTPGGQDYEATLLQ